MQKSHFNANVHTFSNMAMRISDFIPVEGDDQNASLMSIRHMVPPSP